jgi:SAM-dependent methyltransferase
MVNDVSRAAYSGRAAEYIDLLGSMDSVHPSDRQLVSTWASTVDGDIVDAGCGPGHWTNYLAEQGFAARGVDPVPEFISHARNTFPGVNFTVGSFDSLDAGMGAVGGILCWYSLIHHEPLAMRVSLLQLANALKPGGTVLVGFFEGPLLDEFAHAVTPAYRWPVDVLAAELSAAGFEGVESHVRKTTGQRSQAAIIARRRAPC